MRSNRSRASILLIPLLTLMMAGGCSHVTRCPAKGGERWRELTTRHFRIRTSLGSYDAAESAYELEKLRAALLVALDARVDTPGRIEVIVLPARRDLQAFATDLSGYVRRTGAGLVLVTVLGSHEEGGRFSVHAHELAHYLSAYRYPRMPRWVNEGRASYLETIHLQRGEKEFVVGKASRFTRLPSGRIGFRDLWEWDESSPSAERLAQLYAASCRWVTYLENEQGAKFDDFMLRLSRAEEPRRAWMAAFQGVAPELLEREVAAYGARAWPMRRLPLPEVSLEFQERFLSDAEVDVALADLWSLGTGDNQKRRAEVLAHLDEALEHEPDNLDALLVRARITASAGERLEKARAIVKLHPESGRAWMVLFQSLANDPARAEERDAALERAAACADDAPDVLNNIAWALCERNQHARALPLAEKASRIAPWNPLVLDTLAAALQGVGRCEDAAAAQRRALDVLVETADSALRGEFSARLARIERECRPQRTGVRPD